MPYIPYKPKASGYVPYKAKTQQPQISEPQVIDKPFTGSINVAKPSAYQPTFSVAKPQAQPQIDVKKYIPSVVRKEPKVDVISPKQPPKTTLTADTGEERFKLKQMVNKFEEKTITQIFGESFRSGVLQTGSAVETILSIGAKKIGAEQLSEKLKTLSAQDMELSRVGVNVEDPRKFTDKIKDPNFIVSGIAQILPNILFSMGVAMPAVAVGAPSIVIGSLAFSGSATLEGGFAFQDAKEFGVDDKKATKVAGIVGVANGILEALPITKLLSRSSIGKQIKRNIIKEITKRVINQSLLESGTESLQEIISNSVAKTYDENRELLSGVPESAFFGGLIGGGSSLVIDTFTNEDTKEQFKKAVESEAGFARVPGIKPKEPLAKEARKAIAEGKTVEEFVEADIFPKSKIKETVFHGTDRKFDVFDIEAEKSGKFIGTKGEEEGIWLTKSKGEADSFGKITVEAKVNVKNPRIVDNQDLFNMEGGRASEMAEAVGSGNDALILKADNGDDWIWIPDVKNIKTKSQLINIFNEAKPKGAIPEIIRKAISEKPITKVPEIPTIIKGAIIKPTKKPKQIIREAVGLKREGTELKNLAVKLRAEAKGARKARITGREEILMKQKVEKAKKATQKFLDSIKEDIIAKMAGTTKQRRHRQMRAIQDYFKITDRELNKITGKDINRMSDFEFKKFKDGITQAIEGYTKKRKVKNELLALIKDKEFIKVDNLRKSMKLKTIDKMDIGELKKLSKTLEDFKHGDEFLSVRKLELVHRTDMRGIKTLREAREFLSKKKGISPEDLNNIKIDERMRLRWDTSLAEKHPFFRMVVEDFNYNDLSQNALYFKTKQAIDKLFKASRKSNKQTIIDKLIPQDKKIRNWLEAKRDEAIKLADIMTPEELETAVYLRKRWQEMYDYLVKTHLEKMGNIENYMHHIRRGFLETVKEDGVVKAFKEIFKHQKEEEAIFNIVDRVTGEILPYNKWVSFVQKREGGMKPTENVAKSFLSYARAFYRKVALDKSTVALEIYVQALEPKIYTKKGLLFDNSLKQFMKEWLNTKRGRHITLLAKQGGKFDMTLRAGRTITSVRDLGYNLGVGLASGGGETIMNFISLGHKKIALGVARKVTKRGRAIIKKYTNYIGEHPAKQLVEPEKDIGEKILHTFFYLFMRSRVKSNRTFLLGSMTKEEFKAGAISTERLAKLKIEMGRYRVIEGAKSILGATPELTSYNQYKTWAIPVLRTLTKNLGTITKDIYKTKGLKSLTSKEAIELYRAIEATTIVGIGGIYFLNKDDNSFLGRMKQKIYRDLMSILGSANLLMFTGLPRTATFANDLLTHLWQLIKLEEYKQDSRWAKEGELKGVKGFERMFTPVGVSQFKGEPTKKSKSGLPIREIKGTKSKLPIRK